MTKRELIFKAAAKLFAENSYDTVGIREIAAEAGVNSAMISYYFGSKTGLLREIFAKFADEVNSVLDSSISNARDLYDLCDNSVHLWLDNARQNRDIYLVGLRELNRDKPELADLRKDLDEYGWMRFSSFLDRIGMAKEKAASFRHITFTIIVGMIFSDYLLGGGANIDDPQKAEHYAEAISGIAKNGIPQFMA